MEALQRLQGCHVWHYATVSKRLTVHARTHTHISLCLCQSHSYQSLFSLFSVHSFLSTSHIPYAVTTVTGYRLAGQGNALRLPAQPRRLFSFSTYRVWGPPSFLHTGYHMQSGRSLNLVPAIPTIHHTPSWCGVYLHTGENSHSYFCLAGVLEERGAWFHSSPFISTLRSLGRVTRRKGGISRHGTNGKIILKLIITYWVRGYGLQ